MRVEANFTEIASSFEDLPEGDYRFRLEEIEQAEAKPGKNQALMFKSVVTEGEKKDGRLTDFVYVKKNDGTPNPVGLGRIKAYAEAILGEEAANSESGIELDDLKGGMFLGLVKARSYTASDGTQKTGVELKKVLADL